MYKRQLFDPLSAALGASTGELVFSEIMLGQFGGLGELEKFITVAIGVYIAGRLVKDPRNRLAVGAAALAGTGLQLFMGAVVDVLKVQFAVEDFEAVAGLPESVFATEGFAFLNDFLFSGILFCMLPTLYLVPRCLLYTSRAAHQRSATLYTILTILKTLASAFFVSLLVGLVPGLPELGAKIQMCIRDRSYTERSAHRPEYIQQQSDHLAL